ncbi:MAG: hypothetical protein ACC682_07730 [Gemmatimonadota bacterium]
MTSHTFRVPGALAALVVALGLTVSACNDPFSGFLLDVPDTPSDAMLFDFETGRLQDPSAFDVVGNTVARPDQTTQWDFVFRIVNGFGQLLPFSALTDSLHEAGLIKATMSFEEVLSAPDEGYEQQSAVAITEGDVFIVRSRRDRTQFLICSQYMKMEILEIDLEAGTLMLRYLRNPNCGDQVLQPGMRGSL